MTVPHLYEALCAAGDGLDVGRIQLERQVAVLQLLRPTQNKRISSKSRVHIQTWTFCTHPADEADAQSRIYRVSISTVVTDSF